MDYIIRKLRKPKMETQEAINQCMCFVELTVKEDSVARGEAHFRDQEFPSSNQSVFIDPENTTTKLQVVSELMRSYELVKENCGDLYPCLFIREANPSDVCQGRLGDDWFLSTVVVLTEASHISKVIITPQYNEEGVYMV